MKKNKKIRFIFFGTSDFAVAILSELKTAKLKPSLVVTVPDKPKGRKLIMTSPPIKIWCDENKIKVIQPKKIKDSNLVDTLKKEKSDVFVVADYGKIIPDEILNIPKHKTINVHPSLLPLFRGPSPIQSQILENTKNVGVSIMVIDKDIDHGPILSQKMVPMPIPLPNALDLEKILSKLGGVLLAKILPDWVSGKIKEKEQDHIKAVFTKKITKEDGLLDLSDDAEENYRKIKAFYGWPNAYFFTKRGDKNIRIIVKDADIKENKLVITKIVPEGKKEMRYSAFLRGNK